MIDYRSFNLIVENGQADAGQDSQTRLGRPYFQALTGTGKYVVLFSADHKEDWQSYPVDLYSALSDVRRPYS